ncbi:MAG: hypothetical protein KGL39_48830 [Patescibacteria group bacterium]|nr:hypothetical protein [Patescibacteria group bacterium]
MTKIRGSIASPSEEARRKTYELMSEDRRAFTSAGERAAEYCSVAYRIGIADELLALANDIKASDRQAFVAGTIYLEPLLQLAGLSIDRSADI